MTELLVVREAYKQTELDARLMTFRARARLGLAVEQEFAKGSTYEEISKKLHVVTLQIRRYRQAYQEWLEKHPGESLD
jgi:hypothetical protein